MRAGEGTIRPGGGTISTGLMPPHPSTSFEILKYYQNEPKFNGVYSRNNLPKIKDGKKILDEFWIALHVNGNNGSTFYNATYFDSFRVEQKRSNIS